MAKVYHSEIFGLREAKYDWLNKHDINNIKWKKVFPRPEFYLFIPTNDKLANHYYSFNKITEIFPVNSVGIVTARDALTIGWSKKEIWERVKNFARLEPELARQTYKLGNDARDWKVELAQKDLKDSGLDDDKIVQIYYRPFDIRWTYYTGHSRGFHCMPRGEVMNNMLLENIALITSRMTKGEIFHHAQITKKITEVICMSPKTSNNGFVFPLYLYPEKKEKRKSIPIQMVMFEPETKYQVRQPNINDQLTKDLRENFKKGISPEEIFYYIYAILYSNIYRLKYSEFLKRDFPRIPFTKNYKLFIKLGKLGKELAELHTLESSELNETITFIAVNGNNKVEKLIYEDEKVWINKEQYFDNVKDEVWQYQIGGYQVCEKWLKDRKGRTLTLDEIKTYCKIVTALSKTIELQNEIDKYYDDVENTI